MRKKSAHMLRAGMTIVINGAQRTITAVELDADAERVIITCGSNVFRRTLGTKVEVISRG
jgi:hypothetical protein